MLVALALAVYVLAFAFAAVSDLVHYEIPNALSVALAAAFLCFAPALPFAAAAGHVMAGACVLVLAAAGFCLGLMGGGDVKLLAAAALWMGWHNLATFLLLTMLAGAALGLLLLALRRVLPRARNWRWFSRALSPGEGVPYGVAIAGAALALLPRLATSGF
ncbi:MAG TPA: prepilin peptidase [Stellaceae bacterium]|nr:prepilin peptidase [Stellaceae bacterium]